MRAFVREISVSYDAPSRAPHVDIRLAATELPQWLRGGFDALELGAYCYAKRRGGWPWRSGHGTEHEVRGVSFSGECHCAECMPQAPEEGPPAQWDWRWLEFLTPPSSLAATGQSLDMAAEHLFGMSRAAGESDEALRARVRVRIALLRGESYIRDAGALLAGVTRVQGPPK